MRKFFILSVFILAVSSSFEMAGAAASANESLPPFETSQTCRRYTKGNKTELAKLICLIERFQNSEFQIVFDGNTYDANTAIGFGRNYIFRNYRNEQADRWIKIHATHAGGTGRVIYLKYPSGRRRPLEQVLAEELSQLTQAGVN